MISISHWGEFPTNAIDHLAPRGYKFADHPASEWKRPDGMIPCEMVTGSVTWDEVRIAARSRLKEWAKNR